MKNILISLPSCVFRIHNDVGVPLRIFSKNTPENPLEKHAANTANNPIIRSESANNANVDVKLSTLSAVFDSPVDPDGS